MRSGAAPTAVLCILVLVAVVTVLAFFLVAGGVGHAGDANELAEPSSAAVGSEPKSALSVVGATSTGVPIATVIRPREGLPTPADPDEIGSIERFRGTGTLRVHARPPAGRPLPEQWTLVVRPSQVLMGGDQAEERRIERGPEDTLSVLERLPLGGYEVGLEAPRMNAEPALILLSKPHRTDRTVFLDLTPAGYLSGRVIDADGYDVEALTLVLEPRAGGEARTSVTDQRGAYHFEHVLDGEYQLHIGGPDNPLLPARELQFLAPTLTMPPIEIPVLGALEIHVLDASGLELAGVRVTGWGKQGGRVDLTTDERGRGVARFLPAGWFSLIAEHPELGSARKRTELASGETRTVEIRLGE
jgi:hypothetical protein